jgi:hypothetical protein
MDGGVLVSIRLIEVSDGLNSLVVSEFRVGNEGPDV